MFYTNATIEWDFDDLRAASHQVASQLCESLGLNATMLPADLGGIRNKSVDVEGLGVYLIYWATSFKQQYSQRYEQLPKKIKSFAKNMKSFVVRLSQTRVRHHEWSAETTQLLRNYFCDDIILLRDRFEFCPRWAEKYDLER